MSMLLDIPLQRLDIDPRVQHSMSGEYLSLAGQSSINIDHLLSGRISPPIITEEDRCFSTKV